jgi:FkbM family methyltransferase
MDEINKRLNNLLNKNIIEIKDFERSYFDKRIHPYKKSIVLFGAGNLGRKILSALRVIGIEPLAFVDNNKIIWNSCIDGLTVYSPQQGAKLFGKKAAFVVTIRHSRYVFTETYRQLADLNCNKVVSCIALYWKYPKSFLPHFYLDLPHKIYKNKKSIKETFRLWKDKQSKKEFVAQLRYRILLDHNLPAPVTHKEYFPDDLVSLNSHEVFIDCGAYDGDSTKCFIHKQKSQFKSIIAIEPDPYNFKLLKEFRNSLPEKVKRKITIFQKVVGVKNEKVRFAANGTVESAVNKKGTFNIDSVKLDDLLKDDVPTYIKMDIEGSELDALIGSQYLIKKHTPILAICVYHKPDHLWRIPLYIQSLTNEYNFFLRPHDFEGWDLVCYAVPQNRLLNG